MNVFDRSINIDALFKFSQMYVNNLCGNETVVMVCFLTCPFITHASFMYYPSSCRSHSTQVHLKNVYSSLAVCMFVAAAGSYVHVVTRLFQVSITRCRLA